MLLHSFIEGLMVVMMAYSRWGRGGWFSVCIYWCKYGEVMVDCWCKGWFRFSIGEKVLARCWYYGCSFIVLGIK